MKHLLITFLSVIFIHHPGFAQKLSCDYGEIQMRIISKTGLELKSGAEEDSITLITVPYWAKVDVCLDIEKADTVNSTFGDWRKVNYNGLNGYMFDGFLTETYTSYETPKDIRIMVEGYLCAPLNFDPTLFWYGIYRTKTADSLIRVDIEFNKLNFERMEEMEGGIILIRTNLSDKMKSMLLIGSNKPLSEKIVSYNNNPIDPHTLYPGQRKTVYTWNSIQRYGNALNLNAIGTFKDSQHGVVLENYQLRLTNIQDNHKTQDISDNFSFKGESGMVRLIWFGDIDDDNKVDLLFSASSTSENQLTLLLSSKAMNDNFVGKADDWTNYNCY
ncbi:MAG: hypothetical protein CVT94_08885 [Bacteroidetes bacterium HGW-Bacteroidetes-11]|nr:MAG: hypothetical protein CVT94_08885 [Bacteroidetes bacterium HGW-Bacteroidetes-11]